MICTTCNRPDYAPWRQYDKHGRIVNGCVDACHDGRVANASAVWHNRPEARRIRKAALAFRKAVQR